MFCRGIVVFDDNSSVLSFCVVLGRFIGLSFPGSDFFLVIPGLVSF